MNLTLIVVIATLGLMVWIMATFMNAYGASTAPTFWGKIVDAAGSSATKLWAYLIMLVSSIFGAAMMGAAYLEDPSLLNAIKAAIPPEWLPYLGVFIAFVTILARNRTKPPAG